MFIQTERTPNPTTLKFIPDEPVLEDGSAHFTSREEAAVSPLAESVFEVSGVAAVYLGRDFLSVQLEEDKWDALKPQVLGAIMQHYASGRPVMLKTEAAGGEEAGEKDSDPVVRQIKAVLDEKVRPAVARDGGDVTFGRFEDGTVYLNMRGACAGCPSSTMTLKHGIENLLRYYVPQVESVEAVEADV